ncbi:MAG: hypothetical protein JNJ45_11490 [Chthonomonas sp.]|nr:hypothetical protein [Chthonomonas sp.]
MSLLDKISEEVLLQSFHKVGPQPGCAVKYRREYERMQLKILDHIPKLLNDIQSGSFQFGEPELHLINGVRPILSVGPIDRAVERAIFKVVSQHLAAVLAQPNTYARASLRGETSRSLPALAKELQQRRKDYSHFFETDIKKFFPSINHSLLQQKLKKLLPDETLMPLLLAVAQRKPPEKVWRAQYVDLAFYFEEVERGIPQGSCLSPILSSVYLHDFDIALEKRKISYLRYVDDLIAFAESEQSASDIQDVISRILEDVGLTAHSTQNKEDTKAKIGSGKDTITFVGLEFLPENVKDEHIVRPRNKALQHFCDRVTEIGDTSNDLLTLLKRLDNFVKGWFAAYKWCSIPRSVIDELDSHQRKIVGQWNKKHGVLDRNQSRYPRMEQAKLLGLSQLHDLKRQMDRRPSEMVQEPDEDF